MLIISIENPAGCKVSAILFDFDSRWFGLDPGCCLEPLLASITITDPIFNVAILRTEYCIPYCILYCVHLISLVQVLHTSPQIIDVYNNVALQHQYHSTSGLRLFHRGSCILITTVDLSYL